MVPTEDNFASELCIDVACQSSPRFVSKGQGSRSRTSVECGQEMSDLDVLMLIHVQAAK